MLQKARDWVSWDPCAQTRGEISALVENNDEQKLQTLLGQRLKFGTAGLRGQMGAGYGRMNDLVVMQTAQGLCKYLEAHVPDAKSRGIVVGYDHRRLGELSSAGFARITAAVAMSQGFRVYSFQHVVATPMAAYAVKEHHAAAGVMVTASHNPKADNGYKVYWGNGAQIIPPHDEGIAESIEQNLAPWQLYATDEAAITSNPLYKDITEELTDKYLNLVGGMCQRLEHNQNSQLRITYTAMHGVGQRFFLEAMQRFGLHGEQRLACVAAQAEPNPEFPTVKFPNPEEKGALDIAIETANQNGSQLILANDPDADRLAAAEKLPNGQWQLFTGNQIGILLGHYMFTRWRRQHPSGDVSKLAMCASAVSSKMLAKIAEVEGFRFEQTLTGFKWLGNRSIDLRAEGYDVVFAYEEALGYCVGDIAVDKDGISAGCMFAEMAIELAHDGKTVFQHMDSLYQRYGEFVSNNSYVICRDPAKIDAIFERLRNSGQYWESVAGVRITRIRDVTTGFTTEESASGLPTTPDSHMIMYDFGNGISCTLRTSGTEPKIKYYAEIAGEPGQAREQVTAVLDAFVEDIVREMLQPEENGLERP